MFSSLISDVFHWGCLNSYCASLPTNTAPAGYTCPNCKVSVLVDVNHKFYTNFTA